MYYPTQGMGYGAPGAGFGGANPFRPMMPTGDAPMMPPQQPQMPTGDAGMMRPPQQLPTQQAIPPPQPPQTMQAPMMQRPPQSGFGSPSSPGGLLGQPTGATGYPMGQPQNGLAAARWGMRPWQSAGGWGGGGAMPWRGGWGGGGWGGARQPTMTW